nr:MAG TPA: hypothetical protein [Bacteriophage sp.]
MMIIFIVRLILTQQDVENTVNDLQIIGGIEKRGLIIIGI